MRPGGVARVRIIGTARDTNVVWHPSVTILASWPSGFRYSSTCIVDQLFPKVGLAMADVLERVGCKVDFPEAQTCCGQPAFNSGYRDEARAVASHFLDVFRDVETIVVPSGSCTSMVAHHFAELFAQGPGPA